MIILDTHKDILHLQTEHISLIYRIVSGKALVQLYFGGRITAYAPELAYESEELYTTFGSGNRRRAALQVLELGSGDSLGLRLTFKDCEILDGSIVHITQVDEPSGVEVVHHIRLLPDEDIIEMSSSVKNSSDRELLLTRATAAVLQVDWKTMTKSSFSGSWAQEMCLDEQLLAAGIHITGENCGVRTTRYRNSSMIFSKGDHAASEDSGTCLGLSYDWSGNWAVVSDIDRTGVSRILIGEHPETAYRVLLPQEGWHSPVMRATYSETGMGTMTRRFHHWARNAGIRDGLWQRPVVLNSWEAAYFDFDQERIIDMIEGAADLGVELFVLDDGWFGERFPRDDDSRGLGDWVVNRKKLPDGLERLIETCRNRGIAFGLWIEPEMVNPESELFREHPDWIICDRVETAIQERHQYILDLSKVKVRDWIIKTLDDLLNSVDGISYIKWDCNRQVHDHSGSFSLYDDYVKNYYEILKFLQRTHPQLMIQNCASGGGRVDYGALSLTHEFWASDNTDAIQRIFIQWGSSYFFPPAYTAAHISSEKNHITGRTIPLKFRCDVAFSCRLGLELSLESVTKSTKDFLSKVISSYKSVRHIIERGDLYRLRSPYRGDYASILYISETGEQALLFIWQLTYQFGRRHEPLMLNGLDKNNQYSFTELNKVPADLHMMNPSLKVSLDGEELSGEQCMSIGLPMNFSHEFESHVYLLTKKTADSLGF